MTLLVPHYLSQTDNKSMGFSFIVTFIEGLYIASATNHNDRIGSPIRKRPNYIVKEFSSSQNSPEKSYSSNFLVMKTISIIPQNYFKKLRKRVYDKNLDISNTSWVHGFNS